MHRIVRSLVAVLVATLMVAGSGVALAQQDEGNARDEPAGRGGGPGNGQGQMGPGRHWRGERLGRLVRGDLVILDKDGETRAIHVETGTVSDVADSDFVVTGPDDVKTKIAYDDETEFVPDLDDPKDLEGKKVRVIADTKDGDTWQADVVLARPRGDRGN